MCTDIPLTEGTDLYPSNIDEILTNPNCPHGIHAVNLTESLSKSAPFGDDQWISQIAGEFDLHHSLRKPGRPRKDITGS